jgi:ribonuclease BN (tRNA processing enzyme)
MMDTGEGSNGPAPERIRLRMYQVGFGDCFLLSFEYASPLEDGRDKRHILIDFGSTRSPEGARNLLDSVAALIREHCQGRLDAIVVTHRHKDHLHGFGRQRSAQVIEDLRPRLIVRPWTEDPNAPEEATSPTALGAASRQFATSLVRANEFVEALVSMLRKGRAVGAHRELLEMAFDQLRNKAAVQRLDHWASQGRASYVFFGSNSRIEEVVPGIRVHVLGPPTLEQSADIAHQTAVSPEFWMLYKGLLATALTLSRPSPASAERDSNTDSNAVSGAESTEVGPVRWLIERMEQQQSASLRRIVRILDDALNNTSMILLFEVGERRLLFPGDAQIENWRFALSKEAVQQMLRQVDLYKVGHHGSRNATPRSLWSLWTESTGARQHPMTALMSTLPGVHGETEATRVPRATLVAALRQRAMLLSTAELNKKPFVELVADSSGDQTFVEVENH